MSRKAQTPHPATPRKSTIGRPRRLTDEQVVAILAWHDKVTAWKARHAKFKTLRQIAKEMGVTHGAITSVIRQRGEFKQASPEHRETALRVKGEI